MHVSFMYLLRLYETNLFIPKKIKYLVFKLISLIFDMNILE